MCIYMFFSPAAVTFSQGWNSEISEEMKPKRQKAADADISSNENSDGLTTDWQESSSALCRL